MIVDEDTLIIYTDGSSRPSPRRGGIGIRYLLTDDGGEEQVLDLEVRGYLGGKSGQMEIQACVVALREVERNPIFTKYKSILIWTDSQYVADNHLRAMYGWDSGDEKWKNKHGRRMLNVQQWKDLNTAKRKVKRLIEISWLESSSKDKHHKAVHKLSIASAMTAGPGLTPASLIRRKWSTGTTELGSVKVLGQRLTIRVLGSDPLVGFNVTRYRYEVLSRHSPYVDCKDFAAAPNEFDIRVGHCYYVLFNRNQRNPEIVKIIRELGENQMKRRKAEASKRKRDSITLPV